MERHRYAGPSARVVGNRAKVGIESDRLPIAIELLFDAGSRGLRELLRADTITGQPLDGRGESIRVAFIGQQSRLAVDDQFRNARVASADDRQAAGHRFHQRDWDAFLIA